VGSDLQIATLLKNAIWGSLPRERTLKG
jgi:hypothetical protein